MDEKRANRDVFVWSILNGIPLRALVKPLKISRATIYRKLRRELPQEEKELFFAAITNLAKQQEGRIN
jgi:transposase